MPLARGIIAIEIVGLVQQIEVVGGGVAVFDWRTRDALEDWLRTSYRSAALTDPDDETGPVGYDYLLRIADVGAEYSAAECDRAFGARR